MKLWWLGLSAFGFLSLATASTLTPASLIGQATELFEQGKFEQSQNRLKQVSVRDLEIAGEQSAEAQHLAIRAKFYEALNHYALLDRKNAEASIAGLLEYLEVTAQQLQVRDPELRGLGVEKVLSRHRLSRYLHIADAVRRDLATWKHRDLREVERLMNLSRQSLDGAQVGRADHAQKRAIEILDEMIRQKENQNQQAKASQTNPGKSQNERAAQAQRPGENPMGASGPGRVDERRLRAIAESWGNLPPAARAKVMQEITLELPPKYRPLIEAYFKALNQVR